MKNTTLISRKLYIATTLWFIITGAVAFLLYYSLEMNTLLSSIMMTIMAIEVTAIIFALVAYGLHILWLSIPVALVILITQEKNKEMIRRENYGRISY